MEQRTQEEAEEGDVVMMRYQWQDRRKDGLLGDAGGSWVEEEANVSLMCVCWQGMRFQGSEGDSMVGGNEVSPRRGNGVGTNDMETVMNHVGSKGGLACWSSSN